jgi:hypothetical protein
MAIIQNSKSASKLNPPVQKLPNKAPSPAPAETGKTLGTPTNGSSGIQVLCVPDPAKKDGSNWISNGLNWIGGGLKSNWDKLTSGKVPAFRPGALSGLPAIYADSAKDRIPCFPISDLGSSAAATSSQASSPHAAQPPPGTISGSINSPEFLKNLNQNMSVTRTTFHSSFVSMDPRDLTGRFTCTRTTGL